jgi:hypothetical protein
MNSVLQDILGLIKRKKTKTPQDSDYIVSASYDNPQESLKPNPIMHPAIISLKSIKNWILTTILTSGSRSLGQGWTRYDDDQYTLASELSLVDGVEINLPNNSANSYRSYTGIDYYNGTRILADNLNDVYILTVVFKCSAANANQTYLRLQLDAENGTPYERVGVDIAFPRGNDVTHEFHQVFQYYADQNFVDNGSLLKITTIGGTAKIWDIIYFIQKTYKS